MSTVTSEHLAHLVVYSLLCRMGETGVTFDPSYSEDQIWIPKTERNQRWNQEW